MTHTVGHVVFIYRTRDSFISDILLSMEKFDVDQVNSPSSISFLFHISMWWRIFYGTIRIILASILIKLVGTPLTDIFARLMSHELEQDPNDALFQFIYNILEDHSFTVTYFLAAYLFFWGAIDVVLSLFLLRHKLWAFPVSIVLMTLFIIYEIYRVCHTHSKILLLLIILDSFIIYLIYREYKILSKKLPVTMST